MKKYKLIKEYPGSPELGYIANFNSNGEDWDTPNMLLLSDCENYPEFWERYNKPLDFTVLSCIEIEPDLDPGTIYTDCENNQESYLKYIRENTVSIHSIKRLSDGEVLTVGDCVTSKTYKWDNNCFISKFEVIKDELYICVKQLNFESRYDLEQLTKQKKKVILTTKDKVELFENDKFYHVDPYFNIGEGLISNKFEKLKGYKTFSTIEAAKEYVKYYRPMYSLNDIKNIKMCTGCGHFNIESIDSKYIACCPDNHYVLLKELIK